MSCRIRLFALAALLATSTAAFGAAPHTIEQSKKATALVELWTGAEKKVIASAFCVDPSGLFVTAANPLGEPTPELKIHLVLFPGEADERNVEARLLRADKALDLAVLQIAALPALSAFEFGKPSELHDTMGLTAFGYSSADGTVAGAHGYPPIHVNKATITALHKRGGELESVQLDTPLTLGHCGGPVVDSAFRVIGIIDKPAAGGAVDLAIPIGQLQKMLEKPLVSLATTAISYDKRSEPQQLAVKVFTLTRPAPQYTVELSLARDGGTPRTYSSQTTAGSCTFSIVAVPRTTGQKVLQISAKFAASSLSGTIVSREIKVAGTAVRLESISKIERKGDTADSTVTTATAGKEVVGHVTGLELLAVKVGETTEKVDLSKAQTIEIQDPNPPARSIAYTLAVKSRGEVVGEASGTIALTNAPAGAVEVSGSRAPGGGLELLSRVKPHDHTRAGEWKQAGSDFTSTGKDMNTLSLAYDPGEEYDLVIDFTRHSGGSVNVVLREKGSTFMLRMGASGNRLMGMEIAGVQVEKDANAINAEDLVPADMRSEVVIKVRKTGFEAVLNGKHTYRQTTDYGNWGLMGNWKSAECNSLAFAVTFGSVTLHSARLTPITGEGKPQ